MDADRWDGPDASLWAAPGAGIATDPAEDEGKPAGWRYRLAAFVVDVAAAIAIGTVVSIPLIVLAPSDGTVPLTLLAFVAAWIAVTAGVTARTGGQSLGKWVGGMRVVGEDGAAATFGGSLIRDFVCRLPYVIPLWAIVDGLLALGSSHRAGHDRMASTHVVRTGGYRRREVPLLLAVVAAFGVWIGVSLLAGTEDDGYARAEFVGDCAHGSIDRARCGCVYDHMVDDLGHDTVDTLEGLDGSDRRPLLELTTVTSSC